MDPLKEEAIRLISQMPEPVDLDDIMYGLYVIDKIRRGKDAAGRRKTLSVYEMKKEVEKWV
jgi:hypothetical protein